MTRGFAPSLLQRAMVEAGWLGRKTGRGWYHYGEDAAPPAPEAAPDRPAPAQVTEHGASPLRTLLSRSGVEIRAGAGSDGTVDLPSGALLVRCDGRPATALAADRPVVVVDRTLDDATAAGIAIAACEGCPTAAVDEATGLLQAAGLTVYVIDDAPGLVVTRTVAMLVNGAVDARHKGVASAADIDTAMRLGTNYPLGPLAWGQSCNVPLAPWGLTHARLVRPRTRLPPARPCLRRIAASRRITDLTATMVLT